MSYLTTSDLESLVPPDWLTEALDDDADGTADAGTAVIAWAGKEIEAELGPVYGAPIDVSGNAQLAALLNSIGVGLALEALYIRRPTVEPSKVITGLIKASREKLRLLAERKHPLSPSRAPVDAPVSVISEDNPAYAGLGRLAAALALLLCLSGLFALRSSPSASMNASTLLIATEDYLLPLLTPEKIELSVAETEVDALEMLALSPDKARAILSLDGAKPVEGDLNPAGLVESRLTIWFQAPKGMEARPGRSIHRSNPGGTRASFCARLDGLIRKIRAMQILHAEVLCQNWEFKGWDWLKFDGLAAYRTAKIEFTLQHALDNPADEEATAPVVLPSQFRITGAAAEFYTIALAGEAHGRVPRFAAEDGDPTGSATGYAITSAAAEFYTVAFDGAPHGRIPRFTAA